MNREIQLDEEEMEILSLFEGNQLSPSESSEDFKSMAAQTLKKNKKINIRISESDLFAIQRKAAREGIPYQTLIGSVLHKYACGYLNTAV